MKVSCAAALFAIGIAIGFRGWVDAQSPHAPTTLRVLEKTQLSLHLGVPYVRVIPGNDRFYIQSGSQKFDSVDLKGNQHAAIDVSAVPASDGVSPSDMYLLDVSAAPRGGVIAPLMWNPKSDLERCAFVRFDEEGDFDEVIWLDDPGFEPAHVAEFGSSGGFLAVGHDDDNRVVTSLFDGRGKLQVSDVFHSSTPTADDGAKSEKQASVYQAARESGLIQLVSGDDDAVYLYNPSVGRSVYRIRPNGQWTEIKLGPPLLSPREGTMPLAMSVSHSSLFLDEAVLDPGQKAEDTTVLKRFLLSVYNRYDGTLEESYLDETGFEAQPVSLAPRDFYFLKSANLPGGAWEFSLIHAAP